MGVTIAIAAVRPTRLLAAGGILAAAGISAASALATTIATGDPINFDEFGIIPAAGNLAEDNITTTKNARVLVASGPDFPPSASENSWRALGDPATYDIVAEVPSPSKDSRVLSSGVADDLAEPWLSNETVQASPTAPAEAADITLSPPTDHHFLAAVPLLAAGGLVGSLFLLADMRPRRRAALARRVKRAFSRRGADFAGNTRREA